MKRKRVTIHQVAQAAGVSPAAVSFAFNDPNQVGAETAERIRTIARTLGYSPSPIARAMISRTTGVIGMLVPLSITSTFGNPFMATFMQGVGHVCDEQSLDVLMISPSQGSVEEGSRRAPVDGFIILGLNESHAEIEPLRRRMMPFVIVDGDAQTVSEVNSDDEMGAYAAASHLLKNGHRDILVITFGRPFPTLENEDESYGVGLRRLMGYRRAFAEYGLELPLDQIIRGDSSIEGGMIAFRAAWEAGRRPTAVLTMSDAKGIGVVREAARMGLRVPEDLEVIGFDNIPLSALTQPALSTIDQQILKKGQHAAELLVKAINGNSPPEKVLLETHLVLRESTRPVSG